MTPHSGWIYEDSGICCSLSVRSAFFFSVVVIILVAVAKKKGVAVVVCVASNCFLLWVVFLSACLRKRCRRFLDSREFVDAFWLINDFQEESELSNLTWNWLSHHFALFIDDVGKHNKNVYYLYPSSSRVFVSYSYCFRRSTLIHYCRSSQPFRFLVLLRLFWEDHKSTFAYQDVLSPHQKMYIELFVYIYVFPSLTVHSTNTKKSTRGTRNFV